jgi:hypothetical protein
VSTIGLLGTLYKLAHNYEKAFRPACDWQMVAQPTLAVQINVTMFKAAVLTILTGPQEHKGRLPKGQRELI